MQRFNLLDEAWIPVITEGEGTRDVSLKELFAGAHTITGLAGDTKTQDFALFRLLLAVLHTVFSRYDAGGKVYESIELDAQGKQREEVAKEDDDYGKDLKKTWTTLWEQGYFPAKVNDYLETWRDRFYLYDDTYPFFQVRAADMAADKINKTKASEISGKNIDRRISESRNKIALFSPKYEAHNNKEILSDKEIARWLITYQGYTGLADKVIFGTDKYKASKGWLFDIGGIRLVGDNLFESLLLNCALLHPEEAYYGKVQRPCWEYAGSDVIAHRFRTNRIYNLAELYTNWSRAIYIDPERDFSGGFSFDIVKLPEIDHADPFLELMSLWRYQASGELKDRFTPRKHRQNEAIWRSFGLLTLSYDEVEKNRKYRQRKPGIMQWLNTIREHTDRTLSVEAISMQDDGNATSWVPVDEIYDALHIRDAVLTDVEEAGWVPRINDVVNETKQVIGWTYKNFIAQIHEIRNSSSKQFVQQNVEELYFLVDQPFRDWIASIQPNDKKDARVLAWQATLKDIVLRQAEKIIREAGPRDYIGIEKEEKTVNIATAYNQFVFFVKRQLDPKKGGESIDTNAK